VNHQRPKPSAAPAIILVEPQLGENIGMAARAMANFGLSELRLVNPRDGWPNEAARANASGADWVIEGAQVFPSLREAIGDLALVLATTARDRGMSKPVTGPKEAAMRLRTAEAQDRAAGVMFGRERNGLLSDEIAVADAIVTFPVSPAFPSINLAQAVMLVAYEWRSATPTSGELPFTASTRSPLASHAEIQHLFDHLEGALDRAEFFRPPEKRPSMVRNLRNILLRIERLSRQDVRTLRGVVAALEDRTGRTRSSRRSRAIEIVE
jgi:tRNA/rRNA methyltransferase